MLAVDHAAVLVRNLEPAGEGEVTQPRPIVGPAAAAPDILIRSDLGRRGFGYALVVSREEVSSVLAQIGMGPVSPLVEFNESNPRQMMRRFCLARRRNWRLLRRIQASRSRQLLCWRVIRILMEMRCRLRI